MVSARYLATIALMVGVGVIAGRVEGTDTRVEARPAECPHVEARPSRLADPVVRQATLCQINATRRKHGVGTVRLDARLSAAATAHSRDLVQRRYWAHRSPDGVTARQRTEAAGYIGPNGGGENLANSPRASVASFVDAWMKSPPHRKNLLNPLWRDVGIGVARGAPNVPTAPEGLTITTDFGG